MTLNHLTYVLHNVMNWNRGYDFDKRSLKQIAKACADYDNSYSWREYYSALRTDTDWYLTRRTENSIYKTVED